MQDERQRKDEEAKIKVEVFRAGSMEWPVRPAMSDYCAAAETEGKYLVHEIKNPDRSCQQFKPVDRERACRGCRHRVQPQGPTTDAQTIARLGQEKLANAVVEGMTGDAGLEKYIELVASLKSLEIAQAYYAGRFVVRPPTYLATCGKRSQTKSWRPCVVENPHDACGDWDGAESVRQSDDFMERLQTGTPRK